MGGEGRESLVTISTSLLCKSDKIQQSDPAQYLPETQSKKHFVCTS